MLSLDFSSAFDLVNHAGLLFKLKSYGVGGPIFNVFSNFLSNRPQRTCVDGCFSLFKPVLSGVPQGSVLGPLFFILYTADMWHNLENQLVAYADDATLYAPITSRFDRVSTASSLNRDIARLESWCACWGMRINPGKSQSMTVSRSRTALPHHPSLLIGGSSVSISKSIRLLGVTLDDKLTFEEQLQTMAAAISQKAGLLRKCRSALGNDDAV